MPSIQEERHKLAALKRELERKETMSELGVFTITGAEISAEGTSWIEVMPAVTEARNGEWFFTITAEDLNTLASFLGENPDRVSVDYDHSSAEKGDTRAAGWFTGAADVVPAGGENRLGQKQEHASVWAQVKWTPKAVQEIRDGEFRFVSAEWNMEQRDKKTGLLTKFKELAAATLTNRPFFKGLAAVTAKELIDSKQLDALTENYSTDVAELVLASLETEDERMTKAAEAVLAAVSTIEEDGKPAVADPGATTDTEGDPVADEKPQVTDYMKLLGLDETVDPKHRLAAAFREKDEKILALEEKVTALTAAGGAKAQEAEELSERVESLEQRDRERDIEVILTRAVDKGRILPAEKQTLSEIFAKDVDSLKRLIATKPEGFVGEMTPKGVAGDYDRFVDDPDVAQFAKTVVSPHPVDTESAKLHLGALQILKEKGKADTYTNDEYLAACDEAAKQLVY
jgi:phage I-like protein